MTNITYLIIEEIIYLLAIITIYKFYKTQGLYSLALLLIIISSITSQKTITLNNFDINLGIIPFVNIFIISEIIIQKNGPSEIKKFILTINIGFVISYIILYLGYLLTSSNINLFTTESLNNILTNSYRNVFSTLVTSLYGLLLNYKLYNYLKQIKSQIWISNIFTAIITQFLNSITFIIISYIFIKAPIEMIKLIVIRYLVSLMIALLGTPTIYIVNKIREN